MAIEVSKDKPATGHDSGHHQKDEGETKQPKAPPAGTPDQLTQAVLYLGEKIGGAAALQVRSILGIPSDTGQ